ncbi:hypothetical protein HOP61_19670 [Halomonas daqingensis]|uniref:Phage tail tape measure protein n=1 Tax=Billgrantia desiderata TaxID=52021 RepID=A0AAW4Z120_9GAMM|nr:hypothetical protein [Halomonas desiderata]MCE8053516.1 hypothetical protein [Halomonas desiderata]
MNTQEPSTPQVLRLLLEFRSLSDVFRGVGDAIVQSVIGAVAQLAAEWIAFKTMQMLMGRKAEAAAMAGAAATGTAVAASWAPAAAMASLASFGANSAPAMAGISATTALSSSLALTGMAHEGIDSIPQTGTWLLEKGERVTTAETSAKLDKTLSNIERNGSGAGQVIVNNYSSARVNQRRDSNGNVILELIDDLQNDGQFSQALETYTTAQRRAR